MFEGGIVLYEERINIYEEKVRYKRGNSHDYGKVSKEHEDTGEYTKIFCARDLSTVSPMDIENKICTDSVGFPKYDTYVSRVH